MEKKKKSGIYVQIESQDGALMRVPLEYLKKHSEEFALTPEEKRKEQELLKSVADEED